MSEENQDISSMPIEVLISQIYRGLNQNPNFLSHPLVVPRLSEIVAYKGPVDTSFFSFPLLTMLCMHSKNKSNAIITLLENGADANMVYTIAIEANTKITTTPLDAFIEFCTLHSEEERKVLRALLDYGADMDLISEQWENPEIGCPAHLQDIKEFCNKHLAEQEELSCKQVENV